MSYSLFRPVPKGQMRDTENFLNAAVQMQLVKDFKLDAGLNYGIQHTADKHYFVGASCRF